MLLSLDGRSRATVGCSQDVDHLTYLQAWGLALLFLVHNDSTCIILELDVDVNFVVVLVKIELLLQSALDGFHGGTC